MNGVTKALAATAATVLLAGCAATHAASRSERPHRQPQVAPVVTIDRKPPPPLLASPGDHGAVVREIQARLRQIDWYFGDVTGDYAASTAEAVRGFQAKRGIAVTGNVNQRTLDLLEGMTTEPTN
ncbi:MAG TPA: peptidoglycan-binding domain-containing protein, partial [Nocardioidaceae bacterium]|nr:peptidoglycan-binding domain-containing protein [Nocardioidaceae bacterium]